MCISFRKTFNFRVHYISGLKLFAIYIACIVFKRIIYLLVLQSLQAGWITSRQIESAL